VVRSNITQIAAGHDGESDQFDPGALPPAFMSLDVHESNGKVLMVLDANGTLLSRVYDPLQRKYGDITVRPHAKTFLAYWQGREDVEIALWCGAMTSKEKKALVLALQKTAGLKKKTFMLGAIPEFRRRGKSRFFPGSSKVIYAKPLKAVKMMFPSYAGYLQIDDDIEKMMGLGSGRKRRLFNNSDEYVITPKFAGDLTDNALQMGVGVTAVEVRKRIDAMLDEV